MFFFFFPPQCLIYYQGWVFFWPLWPMYLTKALMGGFMSSRQNNNVPNSYTLIIPETYFFDSLATTNHPQPSACDSLPTHQRLSHDDADLALWHGGEVGKQALEDVLPWLALRVNADGHHGWRTLFSLRTTDWRDGGFTVSVPQGRGCGNSIKSLRWETVLFFFKSPLAIRAHDRISYRTIYMTYHPTEYYWEVSKHEYKVPNMLNIPEGDCPKDISLPWICSFLSYFYSEHSTFKQHSYQLLFSFHSKDVITLWGKQKSCACDHPSASIMIWTMFNYGWLGWGHVSLQTSTQVKLYLCCVTLCCSLTQKC